MTGETTLTTKPGKPGMPTGTRVTLGVTVVAAFALILAVAGEVSGWAPLPGRLQGEGFTTTVSIVGDLVARLTATVTLGAFLGVVAFTTPGPDRTLSPSALRMTRLAGRSTQLWFWASVWETFANSAFVNGVPLAYTLRPDAWWDFQSSTPSGLAWLLSAGVAAGCTVAAFAARTHAPFVVALVTGALALTFVSVTGSVSVGSDHDWATDSAIWFTLAMTAVAAAAFAVVLLGDRDALGARRVGRYHRIVLPLVVVAAAGHAFVAWQQLAGRPLLGGLYGLVTAGILTCLALLAVTWAVRQATGRRTQALAVIDAVLVIAYLALLAAENHVPSPRFLVAQSTQTNYLGYEMNIPVTLGRLLSLGRPNWLWVGLAVFAVGAYAWGLVKVLRRGGHWPVQRTIAWVAGWGLTLYLAVTGFWEYSTVVFSWHMCVHMTGNMLGPALCVLGGPLTLVEQASLDRTTDLLAGPRELSATVAGHRPLARVFSPPVLWLNYVGSLFLIYYTPLFPWLMRYHWAHQLMLLYFMVTGYLFFGLIVGVDKQLHDLPHLIRLALVISIMPFHAIFAVGILSAKNLIGADFYRSIDITWVGDLMADQNIAGQVTWILGEIPLFIVVVALAAQWFTADSADSRRLDKAQDAGEDGSFDAYNDLLAQLAERDHKTVPRKTS